MKNIFLLLLILSICTITQAQVPDKWLTKFETSGFTETSRYDESIDYFRKLDESSPLAEMFTFGKSPQGRNLYCIVVSKEQNFNPADCKKSGKPLILIFNGIHSGEIEGKDASMLLLREILVTKEKEQMLDSVNLLIIPVFSVDGHERFRKYNRINQNGPLEMGWRTTAQNFNLNRDWMKADAPEMQAMLKLFSEWLPDFLVDTHTTDGADYQYSVTYGLDTRENVYHETSALNKEFLVYLKEKVEDAGYLVFPYVSFRNWQKGFESGLTSGTGSPRFSNSYAAIQNRPGLLVETHMMKPYKERVFSTKTVLETVINFCSENAKQIVELSRRADKLNAEQYAVDKKFFPVKFKVSDSDSVFLEFKGKVWRKEWSNISGSEKIIYTDKDTTFAVTYFNKAYVADSVQAPDYYIIPAEWRDLADRMKLHGVVVEEISEEKEYSVTRYRFSNVKYAGESYEGRTRVNFDVESYNEKVLVPGGSFIVNTNQRTVGVILHLLEPKADDSFIKWGFMNGIFELKEYFENYVMEKVAAEMLAADTRLKKEFEDKLEADEKFKNDPDARLRFFYERSPYWDEQYRVYPVMRVE